MSGPNVVLHLKRRTNRNTITVASAPVLRALKENDKDGLWAMFKSINPDDGGAHDKAWLAMICNWAPEGGLSLKDMSKWIGLAARVDRLDDTKVGTFTLNPFQDALIWQRLNDEKFKLSALSPLFAEFLLEYMTASGHNFAEVQSGMWDDPKETDELGPDQTQPVG